ncbi:KRAB-A domain-containing protein 2-like [Aphelenchoides fujianensis]|nr:KRAB-A domain-containing protein 2-like [Aphelenchoides fujianensis]
MTDEEARAKFRAKLEVLAKRPHHSLLTEATYRARLHRLQELQNPNTQRVPADTKLLKNCCILSENNADGTPTVRLAKAGTTLQFVPMEQLYDTLKDIHLKLNHAGRNCIQRYVRSRFCNVTKDAIMIFLTTCRGCPRTKRMNGVTRKNQAAFEHDEDDDEEEQPEIERPAVIEVDAKANGGGQSASAAPIHVQPLNIHFDQKPVVKSESEALSRGQFDLFQMTDNRDGSFGYFLRYIELSTRRVRLRPLVNGAVPEIARTLLDIYCDQGGAPIVLQSLHGRELVGQVIIEINKRYPCRQLHGEYRAVFVETSEILQQLGELMKRFNTRSWASLLRILEYEINSTYREDLDSTPFEATFGRPAAMGLRSSKLIETIYEKSQSEDDFLEIMADAELIRCSIFCQSANEPKREPRQDLFDEPFLLCTPSDSQSSCSNASLYNPLPGPSSTPTASTHSPYGQPITPHSHGPPVDHFAAVRFDHSPREPPAFYPPPSTSNLPLEHRKEDLHLLSPALNHRAALEQSVLEFDLVKEITVLAFPP